jgi:hypothetical protein
MERSSWERALARAVTDRQFRARLLADPAGALADYGLPPQDRPLVDALRMTPTLAQLAAGFLHLSATAWAKPATESTRFVEDPFLSPYPSFVGDMADHWLSNVLVPLDQLPHATPRTGAARGGGSGKTIDIKVLNGGKNAADAPNSSASQKRRDVRFDRRAGKPARRPPSPPAEKSGGDAVNY